MIANTGSKVILKGAEEREKGFYLTNHIQSGIGY